MYLARALNALDECPTDQSPSPHDTQDQLPIDLTVVGPGGGVVHPQHDVVKVVLGGTGGVEAGAAVDGVDLGVTFQPGEGVLEPAEQVEQGPGHDDIVVHAHQSGACNHGKAQALQKWIGYGEAIP